ncbi:alpha/beta hydrolase [Congzhengia minquanensis]|uniref:Alpha/beta hydrolase n=1 Tax=Congzhengia minquanensis TaxID=2763657 RepID=A0A926HUD5_9FIRM|nr:alpha/beta hydrolase [Congzhengia minquanensis]MBC8540467.1 alpha/beta hydrolase [Congzhengia minquanensis]
MQVETFQLWKNTPGMCEEVPTITAYIPERGKKQGAVVILPGGGYCHRAPHEGMGYAEFLAVHGYSSFVVEYRVSPHEFPLPLLDARRGIRYVRHYAEKFGIDKNKVAIMGSSAGGHLAALTSTYFDTIDYEGKDEIDKEDFLPNAQILCYPVIDLHTPIAHEGSGMCLLGARYDSDFEKFIPRLLASEKTPQAFIWHTFEDDAVDVRNSLGYAAALREKGVPTELHVFPNGGHGKGRSEADDKISRHIYQWNGLLLKWLEYIEF